MRALLLAPLLLLTAGCLSSPAPVGDAEAAHAGATCPGAQFVQAFNASGGPACAVPFAGFSCPPGAAVTGFNATGEPVCTNVYVLAEAASPPRPPVDERPPPMRSLALTSQGALSGNAKSYTVASASPNTTYATLAFTVNGQMMEHEDSGDCAAPAGGDDRKVLFCRANAPLPQDAVIRAGDTVRLLGVSSGQTLRVLDAQANSVVLTLTIS